MPVVIAVLLYELRGRAPWRKWLATHAWLTATLIFGTGAAGLYALVRWCELI